MASYVPCKKNDSNGYIFYVSFISQANGKIFQVNPTLAAGDVKIAIDDGAPANLGTLPVVDADFTRRVKVTLSQAETNGDNLTIIFSDAAGDEWCDLMVNIQTSAQTLDEMDTNIDDIEAEVADIHDTDLPAVKSDTEAIIADTEDLQGNVDAMHDTDLPAVKAKTNNLPSDPADQSLIIAQTDLIKTALTNVLAKTNNLPSDPADQSLIEAETGTIITAVNAVKAKTDNLPGDPADQSLVEAETGYIRTVVDAIQAKTDDLPSGITKNVALSNFEFLMVLSSDHITPATGKAITAKISKDGGAFGACENSVAEVSHGFYKIDLTQTEMNADVIALKFTETDCDQRSITMVAS